MTLIGIAVVFPIVFSFSGAYKRRESALDEYGSMKAHGRAIFFASRDRVAAPEKQEEAKEVLSGLLDACRTLFQTPVDEMHEKERAVYAGFSLLSKFINSMLEFVMPVLFSVVLVSLENIQEHLEDPFDQVGEDDVIINVEKLISRLEA